MAIAQNLTVFQLNLDELETPQRTADEIALDAMKRRMIVTRSMLVERVRDQVNREEIVSAYKWVSGEADKAARGEQSEWDQRHWIAKTECGTVCCVAGRVVLSNGYQRSMGPYVFDGENVERHVDFIARDLLGLSGPVADALFHWENTIDDLRAMMSDLVGEDIDRLV